MYTGGLPVLPSFVVFICGEASRRGNPTPPLDIKSLPTLGNAAPRSRPSARSFGAVVVGREEDQSSEALGVRGQKSGGGGGEGHHRQPGEGGNATSSVWVDGRSGGGEVEGSFVRETTSPTTDLITQRRRAADIVSN
eukprot:CAMPEP_0183702664 /NCGR_PEP_ID=MMETSP0737-20130205/696_1 /TAXON_ID=385413 /ORGANISM="Thalassiosira miniscula, Strain CCMP1093" /LENGTH=136 /DNA_ID=CAMNT_0025929311 /DNA_START=294 /DNA_END=704 /DNA_ORIENTATION=-